MQNFIHFVVAGGVTTFFSYSIYSLLIYFSVAYFISSFISNVIGFVLNIFIVRLYVFKVKVQISVKEIKMLTLLWLIGVVIHISIIKLLYAYGVNYYFGGAVATLFILFWNYFSRKWCYKKEVFLSKKA
jgi:putative flippase GtrA